MPIMPIWANEKDIAHLQAKTVSINLIWCASAKSLLSSGIHKNPGAFTLPMAMPIMTPWANHYDIAHLQTKTVTTNLIWSDSTQWLLSSSVCTTPRAFIMPMGMLIMPPWANDYDAAHL